MPQIERVQLDLESMADLLDGKVGAMLALNLKRAAADCIDRPGEKKPRSVTLKFEVVPVINQEGYADVSEAMISCSSGIPKYVTTPIQLELNPQGFVMNRNAPESVRQHTADEIPGYDPDYVAEDEPDGQPAAATNVPATTTFVDPLDDDEPDDETDEFNWVDVEPDDGDDIDDDD